MGFTKVNYNPGDVLKAVQMNTIQDTIVTAEGNIEAHIGANNPHNITAEKIGAAKIAFGCYVGDGSSYAEIKLEFRPKFVAIMQENADLYGTADEHRQHVFLVDGMVGYKITNSSNGFVDVQFTDVGVSWAWRTPTITSTVPMNDSSKTYHYVAIG